MNCRHCGKSYILERICDCKEPGDLVPEPARPNADLVRVQRVGRGTRAALWTAIKHLETALIEGDASDVHSAEEELRLVKQDIETERRNSPTAGTQVRP